MTKHEMVKAIMNHLEGQSCGHEGSKSYCEMKKALEKMKKSELEYEYEIVLEGELCRHES